MSIIEVLSAGFYPKETFPLHYLAVKLHVLIEIRLSTLIYADLHS